MRLATIKTLGVAGMLALASSCNGGSVGQEGAAEPGSAPPQGVPGTPTNPEGAEGESPDLPPGDAPPLGDPGAPVDCTTDASPGPSPLRRLNKREYHNTVSALLGSSDGAPADFPPDATIGGFDNNAEHLSVSSLLAEKYQLSAEWWAKKAAEDLDGLLPCQGPDRDRDCASAFITDLAERAFRRPAAPDELQTLLELFDWGAEAYDFRGGIEVMLEQLLQDPSFLYRVETGDAATASGGVVQLTSWEMATRLSYLMWGSMPDAELFRAAAADELRAPDAIAAQAIRLLESEQARENIDDLFTQWFGIDDFADASPSLDVFPDFEESTTELFPKETLAFIRHVFWDEQASLKALLGAPYTFANERLSGYYGLSAVDGEAFQRTENSPKHVGLLSQGGFLASHSYSEQTSPIHRGAFVRAELLCQELPPPPPDVEADAVVTQPTGGNTVRDRFAQHLDPACAGCHMMVNPIGFGFEHYDAAGRYRETENGAPIDASGEVTGLGTFNGVAELAEMLAASPKVAECAVSKLATYGYGRSLTSRSQSSADRCVLQELDAAFAQSGLNLKQLMLGLTQTRAFTHRKEVEL